jgi:uncharacterized YkwD family protein
MMKNICRIFSLLLLGVFLAFALPFPVAEAARVVYQIRVEDALGWNVFSKMLGNIQQSGISFWNFNFPPKVVFQVRVAQPEKDVKEETAAGAQVLTPEEKQMLDLVNRERQRAGLRPLVVDPKLVQLARLKSKDMIAKGYFSHYSPTYGSPFEMMDSFGVSYRYAGENLAGAPTVEIAHRSLMNSPGHRANILNPNFQRIGIGIISGGPYGKMFTQLFAG